MQVNEKWLDHLLKLVSKDNTFCPEDESGKVMDCPDWVKGDDTDCPECWKKFLTEPLEPTETPAMIKLVSDQLNVSEVIK